MAERGGLGEASKLVRRATLANDPALISEINKVLSEQGHAAAVDQLLNRPIDTATIPFNYADEFSALKDYHSWWMEKILTGQNPVQEKMTFFFHSFLTSSRRSTGGKYGTVAQQMNMFRRHALGSFSDLLFEFVKDPLLMRFLNAQQNVVKRPNENLARELMELFTTGIGPYTEADIRNVALAISGWRLENETGRVFYDATRGSAESFSFLGETRVWDIDSVVRKLLDHPATADRITQMLWDDLVGSGNPPAGLGKNWHDRGFDNLWLLEQILKSQEFIQSDHYVRPRTGLEYFMTVQRVLDYPLDEDFRLRNLGHLPWDPPNVAGWPSGEAWLDVGSVLARSQVLQTDYRQVEGGTDATVDEVLDRCSIFEVSSDTLAAIAEAENADLGEPGKGQLRWWIALGSPEAMLT